MKGLDEYKIYCTNMISSVRLSESLMQ